ncbi:MAG: putative rane protein [Oscillospiraceae bacterium]|nr:putative rane protein [Oscillospiraceae bacterium]
MMRKIRKKHIIDIVKWILITGIFGLVAFLCIKYAPIIKQTIRNPDKMIEFKDYINSFGVWGILIVIGTQILQVFFAIIPSEPIELVSGMCYGGIWGFFICFIGVVIGSGLVFSLVKRFGEPLVNAFYKEKHLKQFKFLQNSDRLEVVTFVLYFIPGLPKDIFTYVAALTPMNFRKFIVISSVARIPSIIVTTIGGQNFMEGHYAQTAILFSVFALLGAIGMYTYRIITKRLNKK